MFPYVYHDDHGHLSVEWPKEVMGGADAPMLFTVHCGSLFVVMALLLFGAFTAVKGIKARPAKGRGLSSQLFEVLVGFLRNDVLKPNLGPHGHRYEPFMLTFFFFILFSNLWGMVPMGGLTQAPTGNINVTAMLSLVMFVSFFVYGIREQGFGHFVKNLVPSGLPVAMFPIMYPIELIGPVTKCFALCIRLFANMVAGHIILAAFAGLAMTAQGTLSPIGTVPAYLMSVGVSLMEVFVAFLQAYVFTMLATVFLGSFIHPDH
jgi:F-type H+-transporting ATPase subunit a